MCFSLSGECLAILHLYIDNYNLYITDIHRIFQFLYLGCFFQIFVKRAPKNISLYWVEGVPLIVLYVVSFRQNLKKMISLEWPIRD